MHSVFPELRRFSHQFVVREFAPDADTLTQGPMAPRTADATIGLISVNITRPHVDHFNKRRHFVEQTTQLTTQSIFPVMRSTRRHGFRTDMESERDMTVNLAAMIYEPGQGQAADRLLTDVAARLRAAGVPLAGATQRAMERTDRCSCDMIVTDLGTETEVPISEDRGALARGCRLDVSALEQLVGSTLAALDGGARVLIVNRFGKRESEGRGFRPAITLALEAGLPVLVGVNREHIAAWEAYSAGLAVHLPVSLPDVLDWLDDCGALPQQARKQRSEPTRADALARAAGLEA
jgi:nucleoside-triphosphatase THEP1